MGDRNQATTPETAELSLPRRVRYLVETVALRTLAGIVRCLPLKWLSGMATLMGTTFYCLMSAQRKVALANLATAFGTQYSDVQRKRIARQSFQSFASTLLVILWSPRLTKANFQQLAEMDEASRLRMEQLQAKRIPIIFVTMHYGNWELLGLAMGFYGFTTTVISRTMRNEGLEELFTTWRSASGHRVLPRRYAAAKLLKALKRGESVGLVIDQHVPTRLGGIWCDMFGLPVLTSPAAAQLALHSGAAIVPSYAEPLAGGRIRIQLGPVIPCDDSGDRDATVAAVTQQCLAFCETVIRKQPEAWLWSYKRWKTRPTVEQGAFPFYSRYRDPHA